MRFSIDLEEPTQLEAPPMPGLGASWFGLFNIRGCELRRIGGYDRVKAHRVEATMTSGESTLSIRWCPILDWEEVAGLMVCTTRTVPVSVTCPAAVGMLPAVVYPLRGEIVELKCIIARGGVAVVGLDVKLETDIRGENGIPDHIGRFRP